MNANQITHGEWRLTIQPETGYAKIDGGKGFVQLHNGNCECCGTPKNTTIDQEGETGFGIAGYIRTADARLMAAAPRLLDALERMVELGCLKRPKPTCDEFPCGTCREARELIRELRGEQTPQTPTVTPQTETTKGE